MNSTRVNTDGEFSPMEFWTDEPTFSDGVITGCCAALALVAFVSFILLVAAL